MKTTTTSASNNKNGKKWSRHDTYATRYTRNDHWTSSKLSHLAEPVTPSLVTKVKRKQRQQQKYHFGFDYMYTEWVRTHLHFRIEVLFFGTIFKNSIYIVKKQMCSASCWCCGRSHIDIRNEVRLPVQNFNFFSKKKKGIRTKTANL